MRELGVKHWDVRHIGHVKGQRTVTQHGIQIFSTLKDILKKKLEHIWPCLECRDDHI